MNKLECINFILSALINNTERTSCNVYEECKTICKQNGYAGECFVQLWQTACNKYRAKLNVRDNYGR